MTPKQERFVQEYLIDLNATQAAIRAGYSAKTAEQQGYQLLQNTSVAAAVAAGQAKVARKTGITAEMIVAEMAKIGFANMADYMKATAGGDPYLDFSALTRDQAAALGEVTVDDFVDGRGENARAVKRVKFKLHDKLSALEKIGKHLGMFREHVSLENPDGTALEPGGNNRQLARAILVVLGSAAVEVTD